MQDVEVIFEKKKTKIPSNRKPSDDDCILIDSEDDDDLIFMEEKKPEQKQKIEIIEQNSSNPSRKTFIHNENVRRPTINNLYLSNPIWDIIDPTPDIYVLFKQFDDIFFYSALGCVRIEWSKKMTTCAGICYYKGYNNCIIRLSEPLLKLRPRQNLLETILHEMIHAYLFITCKKRDRDGHGPQFKDHMNKINNETGLNITVYHSFHNEVRHYKTFEWTCNGTCRHRPPFYGNYKAAVNRPPGKSNSWFNNHQQTCGGKFIPHQKNRQVLEERQQNKKKATCTKKKESSTSTNSGNQTALFPWFIDKKNK